MRVYEVMSKAVETVTPQFAATEAKTRMRHRRIHHLVVTSRSVGSLVVTSAHGHVAGIVTVSDLLDLIARQPPTLSKQEAKRRRERKVRRGDE